MADMMDTLRELLGDNADEKISNVMKILNSDSGSAADSSDNQPKVYPEQEQTDRVPLPADSEPASGSGLPVSPELLMQAQQIMSRISSGSNDSRANLLKSLRPFMRDSRKSSIDNAIKMLSFAQFSQFFKGGL